MAGQLPKITAIRRMMRDRGRDNMLLQVDGGVGSKTAQQVILAGANVLVAGSSVFNAPNGIQDAISGLRALV